MLILSRCIGEAVVIADSITVAVCEIHGNQVRLRITAPRAVSILRAELLKRHPPLVSKESRLPAVPTDRSTLTLSRRRGEALHIGDCVQLKVMQIHLQGPVEEWSADIGIRAPRSVPVFKQEIHYRRLAETGRKLEC